MNCLSISVALCPGVFVFPPEDQCLCSTELLGFDRIAASSFTLLALAGFVFIVKY